MKSKSESANITRCLECGKKLPGRLGQKFCNPNCKSAYHYKNSKLKEPSTFVRVENQIKHNRRILKQFYLSGKLLLDKEILINEGFDFDYFTHIGKDKAGKPFYFNFEFSLHELKDKGKYRLEIWQDKKGKKKKQG